MSLNKNSPQGSAKKSPSASGAAPRQEEMEMLIGLLNSGQLGSAETEALRLLEQHRKSSALHIILGTILSGQGKLEEAVSSYRQALKFEPRSTQAHNNLGNALRDLGKFEEAAASYRQALKINPQLAGVHNNLGNVLVALGKLEEAVASYQHALKLKPDFAGVYINLGNIFQNLNKLDEAVASFQRAIAISPDIVQAHNNLGAALAAQGKCEEAVASYRQALKLQPDHSQTHNNLGIALRNLGNLEEAYASFQRSLEINPDNAGTLYNVHSLLLDSDDLSPAISCLETAVKLQPNNTEFRFFLGTLLDFVGDVKGADVHFKEVQQGSNLDRARLDAWNYIKSANKTIPKMIGSKLEAFRLGMNAARNSGLVLEFGVRFGMTIRQIAGLVDQEVHGFDSFEGLPEDWHNERKGSYTTNNAIPAVPSNVRLHKGWFEDTLPEFVKTHRDPVRFVNIDCDLYSATKTVLDTLSSQIIPGTVIVFDEYMGNEHWREDEFKAFQEAVRAYGWNYEYLAFSLFTKQVVVQIL